MPAATPKPSLEDLLTILSRSSGLRANFPSSTPYVGNGDEVELCFKFKREHLGPAAKWVFEQPSTILPTLIELLQYDETLEKAFRKDDPKATVRDAIAYVEQKIKTFHAYSRSLESQMDNAFMVATLKYLRELDRRRREADRRTKEAEEMNARREEEEIRRRVEEALLREKQEKQRAKEEARERWEREERAKKEKESRRTSDSGTNSNFGSGPQFGSGNFWDEHFFDEMLRTAGVDPKEFKRRSGSFYQRPGSDWGPFDSEGTNRAADPPPKSQGKRKWYEILNCPPNANRDQIRRAAREAAKGLHPDTSTDPQAKEKFQAISEAKAEGLGGVR